MLQLLKALLCCVCGSYLPCAGWSVCTLNLLVFQKSYFTKTPAVTSRTRASALDYFSAEEKYQTHSKQDWAVRKTFAFLKYIQITLEACTCPTRRLRVKASDCIQVLLPSLLTWQGRSGREGSRYMWLQCICVLLLRWAVSGWQRKSSSQRGKGADAVRSFNIELPGFCESKSDP